MTASDDAVAKLRLGAVHGGGIGRFAVTVLAVLVIVLATVCFAVRTDGGREFVTNQIVKHLGVEVTIASARIGLPYDLVVEGVQTETVGDGRPGFWCKELRIGLAGWRRYRIEAQNPLLTLTRDEDGHWAPARLSRVGEMVDQTILAVSRSTARIRDRVDFLVLDGSIEWYDGRELLASAKGIDFRLVPVTLPDHQMYCYRLSVQGARGPSGAPCGEVMREWLASETIDYLELDASGLEIPGTGPAFWEVER